ncbi:MAG: type II secretion system F family protein [Vulcanimicrobiota bacterium]
MARVGTEGPLAAAGLPDRQADALVLSGSSLSLMTLHLKTLLGSGVGLLDAFDVLARGEDLQVAQAAEHLGRRLSEGHQLSEALAEMPRVFDRFFLRMIRAAETSGRLMAVLEELSNLLETRERRRRRLTGALAYPAFVLVLSLAMTAFIVYVMLPGYLSIFAGSGLPLPPLTRALLWISQWAPRVSLGAVVVIIIAVLSQSSQERGLVRFRLPWLRSLARDYELAGFCTTLAWLLRTEVPIQSAIATLRYGGTGWEQLDRVLEAAEDRLLAGETLSESLSDAGVFPRHLLQCVAAGEQAGKTSEFLLLAGRILEERCDLAIEALLSLLEPALLLFLGVIVASVVMAALLPTFSLVQAL